MARAARTQHPLRRQPPASRAVFFSGPEPQRNREGDEFPVWSVFVGSDQAAPLGTVYRIFTFAKAEGLAKRMSADRRLELVHEAQAA